LLAFLSVWQILTPEHASDGAIGWIGLAVSVLWFTRLSSYIIVVATMIFLAACVVAVRLT
jgi:hypothetical protein